MRIRSFAFFAAVVLAVGAAGTAYAGPKGNGPKGPTIVDVAVFVNTQSGEFETLIAAINAADPAVAATLTGGGQHTVFAPTDQAFANLLDTIAANQDVGVANLAFVDQARIRNQ